MNDYFDKWGRVHHKVCKYGNPSSNNGWIYTAYLKKLGYELDEFNLAVCFRACVEKNSLRRHPPIVDSNVPISRDEILGMAALGFLKPEHLNGWNFSPFPLPKFNLIETIKQFIKIKDQHRNYFWKNNMDQIYRFAFSVPLSDRHFILSCWGKFNLFYFLVAKVDSLITTPKNGIHWLKYGGSARRKIMEQEFPEDHPLRKNKPML
jgi:hypothetical protein